MFGIGRSSFQKMVDGFLKFRLLRQTTNNSMPLSVTLFAGAYRAGIKSPVINGFELYEKETSRWSFNYQILIARKFTPSFSFQIAPGTTITTWSPASASRTTPTEHPHSSA